MSELISGKEALCDIANSEISYNGVRWFPLINCEFKVSELINEKSERGHTLKFRLKPKTTLLNGIEVPAPFEPKVDDGFWHISTENDGGYAWQHFENRSVDYQYIQFGAWRTEDEIKQVVVALRSIFKGELV